MIGIDVVDLSDPLLKRRSSNDLRFISHPQDVLQSSEAIDVTFWLFWASKEVVFKSLREDIRFDPKQIPVQVEGVHSHEWNFKCGSLFGKILLREDVLIAFGSTLESLPAYCFMRSVTNNPSNEARMGLSAHYFLTNKQSVTIGEDEKMPIIVENGDPVSFSHHGQYLAFAYPSIKK